MPDRGTGRRVRSALAIVVISCAALAPTARGATTSLTLLGPGEQPFIVPPGVFSVHVALTGAAGGNAFNALIGPAIARGGTGGVAGATIAVHPGEVLFAEIGTAGGNASGGAPGGGGANGGAAGGQYANGGGGGGATDIRTCSLSPSSPLDPVACAGKATLASRLLVAGGGGGGGGEGSVDSVVSGGGGGPAGNGGGAGYAGSAPAAGGGGGAGTLLAGGAAGANSGGIAAGAGTFGNGGSGGDEDFNGWGGGGGGGGGVYGGGGGGGGECVPKSTSVCGGGGGGGGGSSGVPAGVTGVTGATVGLSNTGDAPAATFTWTLPAPTVLTGPASGLSATTATLNGTVDPNGLQISSCHFTIVPAPPAGGTVPCAQAPGDGAGPSAVSATVSGLAPATTYTFALVAANTQGTMTGPSVNFTTPAAASPPPPPAVVVAITRVSQSHSRWRRGTALATLTRVPLAPVGTTFAFTLNRPATVGLSFTRVLNGRVGPRGRCVAQTTHNRHARVCRRAVGAGTLSFAGHPGANAVHFSGRMTRGVLPLGAYSVALWALADGRRAAAGPLRFTIVR